MATAQLIRQVRAIDPLTECDQVCDVLVSAGQIAAIAAHLTDYPTDTEVIEAQGQILMPGLIDLYSRSGEPGNESRETLQSLLQAAAAGGITRLGLLPTTLPAIDTPASVIDLLARRQVIVRQQPHPIPQIYPWGALTQATEGNQMTQLGELARSGVVGLADGRAIAHPLLVQRLLTYLQSLDCPVALWPCDQAIADDGVIREGAHAVIYGLTGDPALSETSALSALLEAVAEIGRPLHIMRLSTARGVELLRQAKASGLPVTASTSWMHLLYSTSDLSSYSPHLRIAPPLGTPEDQQALIDGVAQGAIDAIAIDHAPYTYEEKNVGFASAPAGVIGLELAFAALWQAFVTPQRWTPQSLLRAMSSGPAHCWGQSPPTLQVNHPAELMLFDPESAWEVTPAHLNSLSQNTPLLHQHLTGRVVRIWC